MAIIPTRLDPKVLSVISVKLTVDNFLKGLLALPRDSTFAPLFQWP
jgi:hypothetical protein